jgi:hypothetical protein
MLSGAKHLLFSPMNQKQILRRFAPQDDDDQKYDLLHQELGESTGWLTHAHRINNR